MTRTKKSRYSGVWAACVALFIQMNGQATEAELDFATAYAHDNFHTVNLQTYADEVATATAGKVSMRVHAAGTLLKPAEIFAGVREGRATGGEVIMSSLAEENPLFGMDALPFIVSGYADAKSMWGASRPAIEKAMEARGLQLLYAVPWPPQNLYARKPIHAISEFKGLRMRTYNGATDRIAELIQARPVTIQAIALQPAIADGALDLMLTSSSTGVEARAWRGLRYYYKVNAWIPKNTVFIRKEQFDKLDKNSQIQLLQLARVAEERGWNMSQAADKADESRLASNRVAISTMDFFIRQYLDRLGETLAREWLKHAGDAELEVLLCYTSRRSLERADGA